MKISLTLALVAAFAATGAAAEKRISTRSGDPEILLLGRDLYDARGQIAYVCEKLGWKVAGQAKKGSLVCEVPTTNKVSVLMSVPQAQLGSPEAGSMLNFDMWMKVPVRRTVKFDFDQQEKGVVVRAFAERMIPHPSTMGSYDRQPINDEATFNGLLNVMALAGNSTFAPGTRFGDFGYLGFRSDRFSDVDIDGRSRVAIQIGEIERESPAEGAGLRTGDFILKMNGRDFGEYREVAKFLREVEPGASVVMLVERGGRRMELSAVATTPPTELAP